MNREDLLRPTLTGGKDTPALYSSQGFFLSAFFGGPVGAVTYGIANSYRLGRLKEEVFVLLSIGASGLLLFWGLHEAGILAELSDLLGGRERRNLQILMRVVGLLAFGAIYLMHRRFYRAASVSGTEELSGWIPGILSAVVGGLASGAFLRLIL